MEDISLDQSFFLTDVFVLKCRHLQRIHIPICSTERKHLILTGKNGSGKTSLLEAIKSVIKDVNHNVISDDDLENGLEGLRIQYQRHLKKFNSPDSASMSPSYRASLEGYLKDNKFQQEALEQGATKWQNGISTKINNANAFAQFAIGANRAQLVINDFPHNYTYPFVIAYIPAQRNFEFLEAQNQELVTQAFKFKEQDINTKANEQFVHYLIQKRIQQAFAAMDAKMEEVTAVNSWFAKLEGYLKKIFEDEALKLDFNSKNYSFTVQQTNREAVTLSSLSDGFKSFIYIIAELLMRIEKLKNDLPVTAAQRGKPEDIEFINNLIQQASPERIQGIVMIDEVETHLHIALQKQILPFLTSFFPNIQFIVTSHSPYVLSSVNNAIVYDLENGNLIDQPIINYPIEAIVKMHFQVTDFIEERRTKYLQLLNQEGVTKKDLRRLRQLREELEDLPKFGTEGIRLLLSETEERFNRKMDGYDQLP